MTLLRFSERVFKRGAVFAQQEEEFHASISLLARCSHRFWCGLRFLSSSVTGKTSQFSTSINHNACATTASSRLPASSIAGIHLPAGFQISVYARGLKTPRFMTIGPDGVLLVANRGSNSVVALIPGSSPKQVARSFTLVSGLHDPISLDMYNGYLYIGEGSSIARVQLGNDLHLVSLFALTLGYLFPGTNERLVETVPLKIGGR